MRQFDDITRNEREKEIVENYGGIYPVFEAFYIHSIIYSAARSENSFRLFDEAIIRNEPPSLIFATVQEALTHAAALSRFFWPMKKNNVLAKARGERLRASFQLNSDSPLKRRGLRNAFEHFDEDLDLFLLKDPVGYFFPTPIVDNHELAEDEFGNIFKLVDPEAGICVLLGQKFRFASIREEVQHILIQAQEMEKKGSRIRPLEQKQ